MSRTIRFLIRWSWCLSGISSRNSRIERATSVPVTLPAGTPRLVLKFPTDFANINWISFAPRGGV